MIARDPAVQAIEPGLVKVDSLAKEGSEPFFVFHEPRLPDLHAVVVACDHASVLHDVGLDIVPSPVLRGLVSA